MRGSGVPDGGVRRSIGSATGPFAGPSLECPGTAAVDEGLDKGEDGPLDRGSDKDFLEVVLAFERRGRVGPVTGCDASPDLLEYDPSQESTKDRAREADRTVKDPRGLACLLLFRHECLPGRLMVVVTALGAVVCRCQCRCPRRWASCRRRRRVPGCEVHGPV